MKCNLQHNTGDAEAAGGMLIQLMSENSAA